MARPSSKAVVGAVLSSKGCADGRSVVTCVCLLNAVRGVNETGGGRVVVTGARRNVIRLHHYHGEDYCFCQYYYYYYYYFSFFANEVYRTDMTHIQVWTPG